MSRPISVVLVDDHALVREGLRSVLMQFQDIQVSGEADNVEAGVKTVIATGADAVLLDLRLRGENGVELARILRQRGSTVAILVLTVHDDSDHLREALRAGADGYLLKNVSPTDLAAGIRDVANGQPVIGQEFVPRLIEQFTGAGPESRPDITPREREVLDLVAEGLGNREVADRMEISMRTVQKHVESLFKKFNVHDRTELVTSAFRRGMLG